MLPAPETPSSRRKPSALHWVGLALFLTPFAVVPLAMLGVLGGALGGMPGAAVGIAGFGLVPAAFLVAFVGMVLMIVSGARARRLARDGALDDDLQSDGSRRQRSMRGDMPGATDVDYPRDATGRRPGPRREYVNPGPDDLRNPAGPTREAVRCNHCGVYSAPGEQVCARCGATL